MFTAYLRGGLRCCRASQCCRARRYREETLVAESGARGARDGKSTTQISTVCVGQTGHCSGHSIVLLLLKRVGVLHMVGILPCLRRDRPPRHPPPMARPPPPRLNEPLHRWEGGTPPNDWNGPVVVNRPFYDGPPKKAPPPLRWMMPPCLVRDDPWQPPRLHQPPGWAPVKAPPPHLIGNPLLSLRVVGHPPPVKAPPVKASPSRTRLTT